MKITDLVEYIDKELTALRTLPDGSTELEDENGVKIIVPKQAGKQGMIKADPKGKGFVFNPDDDGESDNVIEPGTKVKVQSGGMNNKRSF